MKKISYRAILSAVIVAVCIPLLAQTAQTPDSIVLTKDVKDQTISSLAKEMKNLYFFTDLVPKVEQDLNTRNASGEFDSLSAGPDFAAKLTEDLSAICHDAHLRVRYSPKVLPVRNDNEQPSKIEIDREKRFGILSNGGFQQLQRMDGNVGYIELTGFIQREQFEKPAQAAMAFLANTDALIIDLRHNGGGDPESVQYLCSYLFDQKTHLNDIQFRGQGTHEFWTRKVPGKLYLNKPIYVLTSKRTGSGAEECSYDLQSLHRATIVGESTWGGANPGSMVRLNDHFGVFIPQGRAMNPYTHTNWEGVGVKPDVAVNPDDGIKTAQLMAVKDLLAKAATDDDKARLNDVLNELQPHS